MTAPPVRTPNAPGWDRVVGQDKAVALLQRAAERPVHAYLLVGPRGSGIEEAARCFAAALVAPDGDERAWDLSLRGIHPDVVEIDPPENTIRVEEAQKITDEVYRRPLEGERKVVVVFDAERMNEPTANKLLKTLEEPPPSAVLVLVTAGADQMLSTIRSRCQRVDFAFLGLDVVAAALEAEGVAPERARLLAALGGGRIDRARALGGRLAPVREAFVDAASSLDGTGASVAVNAEAVQVALQASLTDLEATQARETDDLTAEFESAGYPARTVTARMKRLEAKHKREHRHTRTQALVEGLTALETMYRDALAGPATEALNADRPRLVVDPRAAARALEACRAARHALAEHNPQEQLLLERLFLHLPPSGHVRTSLRS